MLICRSESNWFASKVPMLGYITELCKQDENTAE